jgi:organic radical activating enzyme
MVGELIEYNPHRKQQVWFGFEITLKCNNRCEYCYALNRLDNRTLTNDEVFYATIKALNDFVEEYPDFEVTVNLLGGEPLLVKEKCIEFIQSIPSSIQVDIYANLNYNGKHLTGLEKFKNVKIVCSWHESSDPNLIKQNLKTYQGEMLTCIFVSDDNWNKTFEYARWCYENNILFRVEGIREQPSNKYMFTQWHSEEFKQAHKWSREIQKRYNIKDKVEDTDLGLDQDEIRYVPFLFHTLCTINQYNIRYTGEVISGCSYPYERKIQEGLEIKEVYCKDYMCYCDTGAYKKLRKKNA